LTTKHNRQHLPTSNSVIIGTTVLNLKATQRLVCGKKCCAAIKAKTLKTLMLVALTDAICEDRTGEETGQGVR